MGYPQFFVTTVSTELIWYGYSNVTGGTLLFTVSNGNEVTGSILFVSNGSDCRYNSLCLCNGNGATEIIFWNRNGNEVTITLCSNNAHLWIAVLCMEDTGIPVLYTACILLSILSWMIQESLSLYLVYPTILFVENISFTVRRTRCTLLSSMQRRIQGTSYQACPTIIKWGKWGSYTWFPTILVVENVGIAVSCTRCIIPCGGGFSVPCTRSRYPAVEDTVSLSPYSRCILISCSGG
jgi:hypothetical protein